MMSATEDEDSAGLGDPVRKPSTGGPARRAATGVGLVLAAFIAVLVIGLVGRDESSSSVSPLDARPAPPLSGKTVDGGTVDLGTLRGSWVVVNFFATWCPPCIAEHPELVEFEARHAGSGDRYIVSVVFDDSTERVQEFFAERGGSWPVITDDGGTAAVDWAVAQVPESILVAPSGVVVAKVVGGVKADDIDAFIDEIEANARASTGSDTESDTGSDE